MEKVSLKLVEKINNYILVQKFSIDATIAVLKNEIEKYDLTTQENIKKYVLYLIWLDDNRKDTANSWNKYCSRVEMLSAIEKEKAQSELKTKSLIKDLEDPSSLINKNKAKQKRLDSLSDKMWKKEKQNKISEGQISFEEVVLSNGEILIANIDENTLVNDLTNDDTIESLVVDEITVNDDTTILTNEIVESKEEVDQLDIKEDDFNLTSTFEELNNSLVSQTIENDLHATLFDDHILTPSLKTTNEIKTEDYAELWQTTNSSSWSETTLSENELNMDTIDIDLESIDDSQIDSENNSVELDDQYSTVNFDSEENKDNLLSLNDQLNEINENNLLEEIDEMEEIEELLSSIATKVSTLAEKEVYIDLDNIVDTTNLFESPTTNKTINVDEQININEEEVKSDNKTFFGEINEEFDEMIEEELNEIEETLSHITRYEDELKKDDELIFNEEERTLFADESEEFEIDETMFENSTLASDEKNSTMDALSFLNDIESKYNDLLEETDQQTESKEESTMDALSFLDNVENKYNDILETINSEDTVNVESTMDALSFLDNVENKYNDILETMSSEEINAIDNLSLETIAEFEQKTNKE